jgi:hypothetical protein
MKREIIKRVLDGFTSISLAEMEGVRLMNRIDTKYTTSSSLLPEILKRLQEEYFVMEVNGLRISFYRTMYLDTLDRAMYLAHHNGRRTYEKIRVRTYVDSQTVFLEVKDKNNKGRTKKKRIELPDMKAYKQQEAEAFLVMHAKYAPDTLVPRLENSFHRITLVNKEKTERLTIDVNPAFRNPSDGMEKQLDDLVIIELKQTGYRSSFAKSVLSDMRIQPIRISKYCLGTILTVPDVKKNRFKEKLIQINKIKQQ